MEAEQETGYPDPPLACDFGIDTIGPVKIEVEPSLIGEDQSAEQFVCHRCEKSFYNVNALQNHRKMHHDYDIYDDTTEIESSKSAALAAFEDDGICDFEFYPLSPSTLQTVGTANGLTTCRFTEDTTFLIVRVALECFYDTDPMQQPGQVACFNKMYRPKPLVDFRGPFTCTFQSFRWPESQCHQVFFNCCEYSAHYRDEHTKRRNSALRCQVCEQRLDRDAYAGSTVPPAGPPASPRPAPSCRACAQALAEGAKCEGHECARSRPHECPACGKRFTQPGGLQQHMRMHSGVRPFTCTFCAKTFSQKAGLEQHLRTHTKVKPFHCVICNKCFSQSVHLRQHMRTHTNIQPFECFTCGKRFKQSSHLKFHTRTHATDAQVDSLVVERYALAMQRDERMQYLNLANVQPVQDGETMYYAAELAAPGQGPPPPPPPPAQPTHDFPFAYLS